ncbi:hypothetical protein Tco_0514707 [Tanacetum coccineum]
MWSPVPVIYNKYALWGISHWGRKRQQFYGFSINMESARDHLDWIVVRRNDDKLYTLKEGDYKRLCLQDIEDMLLLLVQGKLTNLTIEEHLTLNVSLRMFTRSIVIKRRVEDLQLGVKSYQKKLNLTRPDTYRSNLKILPTYSAYPNPKGFIYHNKYKKNKLMHVDKLYKFSVGILNDVRTALDDILKRIGVIVDSKSQRTKRQEPVLDSYPEWKNRANVPTEMGSTGTQTNKMRDNRKTAKSVCLRSIEDCRADPVKLWLQYRSLPLQDVPIMRTSEFDESDTHVLERFDTSAGIPIKEILPKLNLPDHRSILTDSKEFIKMDMEVAIRNNNKPYWHVLKAFELLLELHLQPRYELPPSLICFLCQTLQRFQRHASHTKLFNQEVESFSRQGFGEDIS